MAVGALALAGTTSLAHLTGLASVALVIAGVALARAFFFPPPMDPDQIAIVSIGTARLTENEFCRHGIVVGQPGVGKTEFFKRLLIELLRNTPTFGGVITDEKCDLHVMVKRVFSALGALDKLIELRPALFNQTGGRPIHRMNLIGDRSISWQTHAQLIVDTAVSQGQKTNQAHFKVQAIDRMAEGMETLHHAVVPVTLPALHRFFKDPDYFQETINRLVNRERTERWLQDRVNELYSGWRQFLGKAPEELSGIRGTIENYTNAYLEPEIMEVFCSPDPTVGIEALEQGKVLLLSIPQDFGRSRKYIQAYLKILYYRNSLGRFDKFGSDGLRALNLHVGLFDEGQNSLLASEDGYSDFNTLDKMRAARCPVWFMMQCYTSALPALGDEAKLDVLKANIGTHVIFRLASEKGLKLAVGVVGEHEVMEESRSYTRGVPTVTRTPKVKSVLGSWVFRKLPDFHAIVRHPSDHHDYHRAHLPPLTDDGKHVAPWYRKRQFRCFDFN